MYTVAFHQDYGNNVVKLQLDLTHRLTLKLRFDPYTLIITTELIKLTLLLEIFIKIMCCTVKTPLEPFTFET